MSQLKLNIFHTLNAWTMNSLSNFAIAINFPSVDFLPLFVLLSLSLSLSVTCHHHLHSDFSAHPINPFILTPNFENKKKNFLMPFQMFCYFERQHLCGRRKKVETNDGFVLFRPQTLSGLSQYVLVSPFMFVSVFFPRKIFVVALLFSIMSFIWVVCSIPRDLYVCTQLPNIPSHAR